MSDSNNYKDIAKIRMEYDKSLTHFGHKNNIPSDRNTSSSDSFFNQNKTNPFSHEKDCEFMFKKLI